MKIGTKLKAKDMVIGHWYRTDRTGRFVAGGPMQSGKHILIYIDGDMDMQSCEGISLDTIVETAVPKN